VLKWLLGIVGLLVLIVVVIAGIFLLSPGARKWVQDRLPKPDPTSVRLEKVTRGDLTRTVNAPGSIEPKTKVQISAQVVARIVELPFREGDAVKKGEVVVRLDSRDLVAQLESSQASLKAEQARRDGAEAALKQAENEARRTRALFASKDKSQAELDAVEEAVLRATSSLNASKANIEIARANITRAQKDLENAVIIAPFDGTIVKLNAEVGELVLVGTLNNAASVIMEIADLGTMLMKARVDEANIAPVIAGQTCKVYINAFIGREFAGKVERVGLKRQIDRDGTGYFEVEVLVTKPPEQVLASGLTANVDINVQTLTGVLKVPSQAIVDRRVDDLPSETRNSPLVDRNKPFARIVYVIRDGKAVGIPVVSGMSDLTHTVIEKGLNEGDNIITGPFKVLVDLKDGKEVIDEKLAKKKKSKAERKDGRPESDDDEDRPDGAPPGQGPPAGGS
jgi:HlyD family secretion protein